jgi:hypothetical protein
MVKIKSARIFNPVFQSRKRAFFDQFCTDSGQFRACGIAVNLAGINNCIAVRSVYRILILSHVSVSRTARDFDPGSRPSYLNAAGPNQESKRKFNGFTGGATAFMGWPGRPAWNDASGHHAGISTLRRRQAAQFGPRLENFRHISILVFVSPARFAPLDETAHLAAPARGRVRSGHGRRENPNI